MIPRYTRPEMAEIWSDEARFRLWLEVETVALEVCAEHGLVPQSAVEAVRAKGAFNPERINELEKTVKHDVIAFLTNVTEFVGEEGRYLHFGMTSSDLIDTAFSLQLCQATDRLLGGIDLVMEAVKRQAFRHKKTPCIGRSHGIHAEPTTFGLKLANWYAELGRNRERLQQARAGMAVGAISGPVGTFSHLPPSVEAAVCERLGLKADPVSTQVVSRDRHAALFQQYAVLAGTLERLAVEIRHLQRTEVREAEEHFSAGQKGSSAMPHKRNPILSENVTGLARLVRALASASLENIALWHERDISHSSVERVMAPDVTIALDFMLHRLATVVDKLVVYPENMLKNIELTGGLVFSAKVLVELSSRGMSRERAYEVIQRHALATWDDCNAGKISAAVNFKVRLAGDSEVSKLLSREELDSLFSLDPYFTYVDHIFERVFV